MTPQAGGRYNQHPSAFVEHNFIQRPDEEPVSRTYQYRKVMKPMLERKRRARINRCLDELKELMVTALQAEGENVAKLEKADILELTVRHLHGLRRQGRLIPSSEGSYAEKFKAGFTHCATEVSQFIASAKTSTAHGPVEAQAGSRLLQHLSSCIRRLETTSSTAYPNVQPQVISHGMPTHSSQNFPAKVSYRSNNPSDVQMKNQSPHDFNIGGHHHLSQDSRRAYAPPSPPASPASTAESSSHGHAHSVWRPW